MRKSIRLYKKGKRDSDCYLDLLDSDDGYVLKKIKDWSVYSKGKENDALVDVIHKNTGSVRLC